MISTRGCTCTKIVNCKHLFLISIAMLWSLYLFGFTLLYFKPLLGACMISIVYYLLTDHDEFVENVRPPKMRMYGLDIFPLVKKIFKLMPDSTRKNFAIKMVIRADKDFFWASIEIYFLSYLSNRLLQNQIHVSWIHLTVMVKILIISKKFLRIKSGG